MGIERDRMTSTTLSIYRKDKKNVGDWWSVPARYLPIRSTQELDLVRPEEIPNKPGVYVVGGGGLGREGFLPYLDALRRDDRQYKLIAWGVGSDSVTDTSAMVQKGGNMSHLLKYFAGFDQVGSRIWEEGLYEGSKDLRWVPCASCLHTAFHKLRDIKPTERFGFYAHLRVPLEPAVFGRKRRFRERFGQRYAVETNRGTDIEAKLSFMARHEFIVTNSYHGVYWATLLGRRVVCYPFKDGLYSFRHPPAYGTTGNLEEALEAAVPYPDALDECRAANLDYYLYLRKTYGDF